MQSPAAFVPFVHVTSVPRSVAFYEKLGFAVAREIIPDGASEAIWANLVSGSARLMVGKADGPVVREEQAVLFYLYVPDVHAMHAEVAARGITVSPMKYPFYCPDGEFRVDDPDGYCVMITHA